ncbi:MAG TPA: EI24 domain-containing protein [Burkholderiales bacterium]|nr:EI24 domain-containing protein [Burkholderiales bacterium]
MSIAGSVLYGFANVLHPRMLWLMLWPMLVALVIWGTVAFFLWTKLALWVAAHLDKWLDFVPFMSTLDLGTATLIAANVLLFILFVPLVYLTALFILGIFGMQKMVEYVASRSFPDLERRRGGGIAGSGWNGVVAFAGMAGLFLASLPLWILPPLWPVIPVAILAWGNQRLLRYDALAEHADAGEMERVFRERRGPLYVLGLLLALTAYIPVVGFLAPVVFGLAFIRYLLGALAIERGYGRNENKELVAGTPLA